jgi:hypothetical protein
MLTLAIMVNALTGDRPCILALALTAALFLARELEAL